MSAVEAVKKLSKEIAALEGRVKVDDDCMKHLYDLYDAIWIEACYDSDSQASQKFAEKLLPHIQALNDKLHFKR